MKLRAGTFRNRLVITLLGFVLLAELLVTVAILNRTYQQQVAQSEKTLRVADRVLDELLALRSEQLLSTVSILTSDYGFKSAIATEDGPTQRTVLRNFGNRAQADLTMLATPEGDLSIIEPQITVDSRETPFRRVLERAHRVGRATGLVMVNNMPYQFVIAPVNAPRLIGWIGMGFLVDADVASKLASVTGVDVEFIVEENGTTVFTTATDPDTANPPHIEGHAFLINRRALFESGATRLDVALSLSRDTVLSPYYALATNLSIIFFVTLGISALVALALGRRLAQPVLDLSRFAESVAAGHYHEPPSAKGIGEFDILTDALNDMQQAVRQRENRIRHQATHDTLTGLRNRSAVRDTLFDMMQSAASLTLLRVSIHGFSRMNGALGYKLGDEVLKAVADRLKAACTEAHTLGRIEGNEFLVLLDHQTDDQELDHLVARIRECVEQPVHLQSTSIQLLLEIGIVRVPEHGDDIEAIWRRAVIARKASGTQRCRAFLYQTGMDESHQRELAIIQGIPEALERDQFSLVYQPKMGLSDASIHQVEALARWRHPELGAISPEEFIRLAESSGQIRLITDWVVRRVCSDLLQWRKADLDIGVAINLSGDEIASTSLDRTLSPLFVAAGKHLPITLEVTESALLRDPETALNNLRLLQKRGARISVDDFGTGYSSLSQLKQLSPDEIKIDKSFVFALADGAADQFIVDLIIDLGHKLELEVVAEGIENAAALRYLRKRGANLVQGYFLARPMPSCDLPYWLRDHRENRNRWLLHSSELKHSG